MIRLGPLGLKKGLKRIKNLIVEEISLVDRPAIRRQFLLIKRDSPNEVSNSFEQGGSSMGFEEVKELEDGELMVFEREEELALPPDVVRQLKMVIGLLSKLIGYKYKAKYKYTKPTEKKSDEEQAKKKPETEEEKREREKKEKEEKEKAEKEKKQEKDNILNIPKTQDREVSKELADKVTELQTLTEKPEEMDFDKVQEKIDEIMGELKVGSGGKD
ncbi:hypothetical protein ES702_07010 [subsurface metagenome]